MYVCMWMMVIALCMYVQVHTEDEDAMIPRIAHLQDELEKRDKIIARLKKDNITLKVIRLYLIGQLEGYPVVLNDCFLNAEGSVIMD